MMELLRKYKHYILIGIAILCAGLVYIWIPDSKSDAVTANQAVTKEENRIKKKQNYQMRFILILKER